jgi:ABC-type branched-subunit amino acid transport system ATPase component
MILKLEHITGGYAKGTPIIKGVDLELNRGEVLAIIGQNGAGKSTLAKAIINVLPWRTGKLFYKEKDISHLTTRQLNLKGITYYMQGGRVFNTLSVKENIRFVLTKDLKNRNDELLSLFPALQKHWLDDAGILSGGERHQLALAMVLAKQPELLILDEPSAGLSPAATNELYDVLNKVKQQQISIILIEQNISKAIAFSQRIAVMQEGKISTILMADDNVLRKVQEIYFGMETIKII